MKTSLKKLTLTTSLLGCALLIPAAHAADFEDYARVINVTPQVEQINIPRQECHTEYESGQRYRHQSERSSERGAGGSIIGGIAGGLLGSQIGNGNGRIAAAAAGALTGAIVGDRIENNGNNENERGAYENRPVRQCRNVDRWETRNNGYSVTYEYNNRTYTTIMPYDPGSRLRLHVSVTPRP